MSDSVLKMRPSKVLAKLRAGEVALCIKMNLTDAAVTDIAGLCGFDCVWVDTEHCPSTLGDIMGHVRASKNHDMDCVVRVQRGSYSDLIHPLEMDATGIMVPHVMSLEDAKKIVYNTRFHPIGRRPWDGGNTDGAYCMMPRDRYLRDSNEQRFVILQIEDPEVLDDLDAIAQLEGVDMLFYGMGDFSQAIGAPGQFDHPLILETKKRIAQVARKHGKFAGAVGNIGNYQQLVDLGYQFISVGSDVVSLGESFKHIASTIGKLNVTPSDSIYSSTNKAS